MTRTDYVIVGAGSAGCVLARRLSEDPSVNILLLEAGPPDARPEISVPAAWPNLFKTEYNWGYVTAPQMQLGGREVYFPRGKTLGGSSSVNAQVYLRGHRADFDEWASLGNAGWSYDEVLRYFKKSENNERGADAFHGVGGPQNVADQPNPNPLSLAFLEGAVATGLAPNADLNGKDQDGAGLCQFTQKAGKRHSTAAAYLEPARTRQNLEIVTGAHATRILLEGRRAVGVVYQQDRTTHEARATREVILCGGAIHSPQLLMLSGIGPADRLARLGIEVVQSLPGVGQNLQDHAVSALLHSSKVPISLLAESSQVEAIAYVRTQDHLPAPDLQMFLVPILWLKEGLEPPTQDGFTIVFSVMKPRSVGALRLRTSDPFAPPAIDPAFLSDEKGEDQRVLREGFRLARRIVATTPFDAFRGEELAPGLAARSDDEIDEHVRRLTQTHYHPVGTCKMGVDANAVVDLKLRVHGIDALRVADASIMPTIPRANTNAATIMIGEKAADLIKE